jgi:hypothetical protein
MQKGRGRVHAAARRAFIAALAAIVICCVGSTSFASSVVTITSPSSGASVSGEVTVVASVGSGVWWAELYVDGNPVENSPPYSFSWNSNSVANGSHTLAVSAFARGGTTPLATSSITVEVANGSATNYSSSSSIVSITSPASGSSVSGEVTVVAAVGSGVWWAELYLDGQAIENSPPYSFGWNSASVANGTHKLSVNAFAREGTTPLATASISVVVANRAGGSSSSTYFSTLAPHVSLPSDSQCAALIASTSETIPSNVSYNSSSAIPTASELTGVHTAPVYNNTWVTAADFARVDGNYSGSTDMIIRWAACKWGIDENVARAEAWVESGWRQDDVGDWRSDLAECERGNWDGWNGSGCWQSYGILSVKLFDFNAYPEAITSTAFNADFRMAYQRACMNGDISYLADQAPTSGYPTYPNGTATQMLWGCMGDWYSGNWYDSGALQYISQIQDYVASQPWK